ncbi:abortive infection system antitoxin AbiGi family protein [Aeromonas salmonicida]|uniref:abortive infection system antitoxin AbiGi family protein n=1 Tax=Aeromonas salmonicida TaxID=645 RepID=UPI00223F92E1|nr:abortive infection system antitoxin AbiGi family protein [Aeromonas salmonicida]
MTLSTNTIMHFTNTKAALRGILESDFNLKYCNERIEIEGAVFEMSVPMVSFCDIPLSEVKEHITKYGSYGIGLTREWAERNGLNPVLYLERKSRLGNSLEKAYDHFIDYDDGTLEDLKEENKAVYDIFRYVKNYQADLIRGGRVLKDYRFSDEREWRYVPCFTEEIPMLIPKAVLDSDTEGWVKYVYKAKEQLKGITLSFQPNDIKYIIIENDAEISEFLDLLRRAKGNKYSYNDIERLMTRILTTEQIVTDM